MFYRQARVISAPGPGEVQLFYFRGLIFMKLRKSIVVLLSVVLVFSFISVTAFADCYHAYCSSDIRSPQYCPYNFTSSTPAYSGGYSAPAKYTLYYYPNYGSVPYFSYYGCVGNVRLQSSSRSGYSFQYWCSSPSGYGDKYYAGNYYYLRCNTKLYAIWKYNTPYYNYNNYYYNDYYYDYYYNYYYPYNYYGY